MSQQELLTDVVRSLEKCGIQYMLTGSMVSSLQGEPRATHDIDIVVSVLESHVTDLVAAFPPPDYYLSEDAVRQAVQTESMFNLIASDSGDKVDFWMLTSNPFDRSRFQRRRFEDALGLRFAVSAPEDTILAKLDWARRSGGSEKQFGDALRVYEVQFKTLDLTYLELWISNLGLESLWTRLKREAEPLE